MSQPAPRLMLVLFLMPLLAGALAAQGQLYSYNVSTAFNGAEESARWAGDVNRDGVPDLILSGLSGNSARVFSGKDGELLHLLFGGATFGEAVSGAGDVNLDGYADVIVGAPGDDTENGTNSGSATLFSGEDGSILYHLLGDSAGDAFGSSVAGAGDVNQDGYPDFIVGAPMNDVSGGNSGSAFVYSGEDGSELHALHSYSSGDNLGNAVAGAGDVNMDGFDDLIVGLERSDPAGTSSGSAYVYSGLDGSLLRVFVGESQGSLLGCSVDGAGDVNQDGQADLIVGASGDTPNGVLRGGRASVFSGFDGATLFEFDGEEIGAAHGSSAAAAGDPNGDGYPDLIVGAPLADPTGASSGQAVVYLGTTGEVLYTLEGSSAGHSLGHAVDGLGDVNEDGYDDLIVGASASAGVYSGRSVFIPGDTLVGEIRVPEEHDQVSFFGFRGMKLRLEIEVTSGSLIPIVEVLNPFGVIIRTWTLRGGPGVQRKQIKMPSSGRCRLRMRSRQGSLGEYEIRTEPVFPGKSLHQVKSRRVNRQLMLKTRFDALPGALLDATATPRRGFTGPPGLSFVLPDGSEFDTLPFTTVGFGDVLRLEGMPLLDVGSYRLNLLGESRKSKARIELTIRQPVGSATLPMD
ncbi:MAG: integrin alpha [Planctomycetota bacterium]